MITNQILTGTIEGLKKITNVDMCVLGDDCVCLAATCPEPEVDEEELKKFISSAAESQEMDGNEFFKVTDEDARLEYVLMVLGGSDNAHMAGKVAAFQLKTLSTAYRERYDKDNFIKNLLLDNLLLVDIFNRAKKLHIEQEAKRVVMVVETGSEKNTALLEAAKMKFEEGKPDFVTAVDEKNIILIREVEEDETDEAIEETAKELLKLMEKEGRSGAHISYGTAVPELKDVSRSYKEAAMALDVGKIFFADRNIIAYSSLGIGRLIYQLPLPLCRMFISEIFGGHSPEDFDEEMLTTIDKFFENSLNVSETSRQLFIHRNTLVYRLDKLQKMTGLDLRIFEDAITFKIALMVSRYMKYMNNL